jgi:hypothetical protein
METRITNIVLNGDRFTVFASIKGNDEVRSFMPEVTAQDIKNWVNERILYYEELEQKNNELQEELTNIIF